MKIYAYLLSFLLIACPIFANPLKIDLTRDCTHVECKPQIWYLNDRFEPSFLELTSIPEKWTQTNQFPIWLNKFFTREGNVWTYSMLSFFDLPENAIINKQTGIRLGEIGEVFEIYLNGNLIVREGEVKNGEVIDHKTVRGKVYEFDKSFLKSQNNQLLIKISGDPKYDHTGFYLTKGYEIGFYKDLEYEEQDRVTLILIGIYFTIGIYHLFLYLKRRKERHNLYYALYIILLGTYLYTRSSAIFEHNWDTVLIQRVELCVLYPLVFFIYALQEQIFFQRIRKITSYYGYFLFLWSAITIFVPMYLAEHLLRIWQITFITFGLGLTVNIMYISVKNKLPNAKRLMVGMIFLASAAIFDVIDSLILNTGLAFTKYAFFIYVFGFATILANNFIKVHTQIEDLNETLEKKVEDRTEKLTTSLEKVNELKRQQDGDYYLTSLLIDPLGSNRAVKEIVNIEFLLKQKKTFSFKGNHSELGGDLCRAETIQLKNRSFTVFFNADAMGKSMQGAGGAIVVGAVFDSIIERTKLSQTVQDSYPERWLKNSFVELHKVFISFDCTMLVSILVGLVDNSSGLLYYINAEHPYPVIYRDGKASFAGDNFIYRKLGMPVTENAYICVDTFQIKQGDVFISGSDGRDDIIISDSSGVKALNTDENVFLRVVEKADGNLNEILNLLIQSGDLTDDLSLLKINLKKNPFPIDPFDIDEVLKYNPIQSKIDLSEMEILKKEYIKSRIVDIKKLKYFALKYRELGKLEEAIFFGKEYLDLLPNDDEMIFKISKSLRNIKSFAEAIEFGERLRLRRNQNIENIINLAECHIALDNFERAKLLLHDILLFDKNNIAAQTILQKISD